VKFFTSKNVTKCVHIYEPEPKKKKLSSHVDERVTATTQHKHSKTVRLRRTEQLAILKSAGREKCWNAIGTYVLPFILLNFTLGILLRLAK
jgi:hypothetical protein